MIEQKMDQETLKKLRQDVSDFLLRLVAIRSYPNKEQEAAQYCHDVKMTRIC